MDYAEQVKLVGHEGATKTIRALARRVAAEGPRNPDEALAVANRLLEAAAQAALDADDDEQFDLVIDENAARGADDWEYLDFLAWSDPDAALSDEERQLKQNLLNDKFREQIAAARPNFWRRN